MKRVMFEQVVIGNVFHHNKVGYTKISNSFAEVNDTRVQAAPGNRFFNGPTWVEVASE